MPLISNDESILKVRTWLVIVLAVSLVMSAGAYYAKAQDRTDDRQDKALDDMADDVQLLEDDIWDEVAAKVSQRQYDKDESRLFKQLDRMEQAQGVMKQDIAAIKAGQ